MALVVLAVHAAWIGAYFASGHEIRDFVKLGPVWVTNSDRSDAIRIDPDYDYPENRDADLAGQGYDGQFYYYIAADPENARYYIDDPPYRYSRILYPMLARHLALAEPELIPYPMLLLNWLAAGLGTLFLAAWLMRKGVSPWVALAFGLFPGLILVLQRDLTEVLAYALVAVAVFLFDYGGRRGVIAAALVFALAGLARETTVVFPLVFAASILAGRPNASSTAGERPRLKQTIGFLTVSLAPLAIWTFFLWSWLGRPEVGAENFGAPFVGLFSGTWDLSRQPVMVVFLALPALVCSALALRQLRRSGGRTESFALLANVTLIIVLAAEVIWRSSYTSMGRNSIAIVLAAALSVPYFREQGAGARYALAGAFALWLVMAPVVLIYGFTDFKV